MVKQTDKQLVDMVHNVLNDKTTDADKKFKHIIAKKVSAVLEDERIRVASTWK